MSKSPKKYKTKKPVKKKRRPWLKILCGTTLVFGLISAGVGMYAWNQLFSDIPEIPDTELLWSSNRQQSYEFHDIDGDFIIRRGPHYGRVVAISELAPHISQAFIAAEDKRFYEHNGADTTAIIRAVWSNWRSGRTVSGASTITQQLVKNLLLGPERTFRRKAQEIRLARQLETRLTKDEILTLYLNRIYFGSGAYGISAAADEYFGKAAAELTLAEAALLATLPKAPSRLALDNNLDAALERQVYVLAQMVEAGFISNTQKETAAAQTIELTSVSASAVEFGYVLDMVTERLTQILPDAPGDLIITLSIEDDLQREASAAINARMASDGVEVDATQSALVIMRPNGEVAALVGGLDYGVSQFNRAVQAKRQPGSSFKPFVFAAALQQGADPYAIYEDAPVKFGKWRPKNYNPGYFGPVTLSEAFARSLNTVAATLGNEVGEERIITLARNFGITSPLRALPSIALGSQEVSLYELTRAYGTFAKSGQRLDPYLILKVEDSRGHIIYERRERDPIKIFSASLARDMNAMMARVVQSGTGTKAAIENWTVAGKTGTSQDWRDAWFVGYTSELIAGVWVGNDNDKPMKEVSGGGLPAIIWSDVMTLAHNGLPPRSLPGAEGLVTPTKAAEQRITFYRNLAGAFGEVAERTPINVSSRP